MTVKECGERLRDLRLASDVYTRLYNDMKSSMYKCKLVNELNKKVELEIKRLSELMVNDELEDSYDQNTGLKRG